MTIALCVVGKSKREMEQFVHHNSISILEVNELALVQNPGAIFGGYGRIGNRYFDCFHSDVFGICHADVIFTPGSLQIFEQTALKRNCATGLVGRSLDGTYVWSKDGVGGPVSTLDSCSFFLPKKIFDREVSFDTENFDSFHCCVEDICLQMAMYKHEIYVPQAFANHLEYRDNPPDWMSQYWVYRKKLQEKWQGKIEFITT